MHVEASACQAATHLLQGVCEVRRPQLHMPLVHFVMLLQDLQPTADKPFTSTTVWRWRTLRTPCLHYCARHDVSSRGTLLRPVTFKVLQCSSKISSPAHTAAHACRKFVSTRICNASGHIASRVSGHAADRGTARAAALPPPTAAASWQPPAAAAGRTAARWRPPQRR